MVDYSLKDLFGKDNIDKQLIIEAEDGSVTITNIELHQESFELTESICSESELTFGACEAAAVKFTISNVFTSLKDKWITIKMILDGNESNPFVFGRYKVVSDKPTADRTKREIEAYDALYDVINADVADWYNELLPDDDSTTTMKAFRDSFFAHFGIAQEDIDLANDSMSVEKTVAVETLSGSQVLNAICEINGCMGHIGRDGKFEYIHLTSSSGTDFDAILDESIYITAEYEDYEVVAISGVQIRQEENDAGTTVGTADNAYIIEGNYLVYGKTNDELKKIAQNILSKISRVTYRPYEVDAKGNPCIEVGDTIQIPTKYATINSFVLKRTLKGIQALRDNYSAEGEQLRSSQVNSINKSIIQLKGKTNTLERNIEQTKSTISDIEQGLKNEITQTAKELEVQISETNEALDGANEVYTVSEKPTLTNFPAYNWTAAPVIGDTLERGTCFTYTDASYKKHQRALVYDEVGDKTYRFIKSNGEWMFSDVGDTELSFFSKKVAQLKVSTDEISASLSAFETTVKEGYLTKTDYETSLALTIKGIEANISKTYATNETVNKMQTQIKATAEGLAIKISKDEVIATINASAEKVAISAEKLDLAGYVTISSLKESGKTIINADNITTGTVKALTLEGCIMNGGAVSIGGNNIIMNEAGLWIIGDGEAEAPSYKINNAGQISQYIDGIRRFYTDGHNVTGSVVTSTDVYSITSNWYQMCLAGNTTSDRRLKNDIEYLSDDEKLELLFDSLKPATFYFKKESGRIETEKHIGFIAQDIQLSISEDSKLSDLALLDTGNPDVLGVDKQELIALLVWQVQKLKTRTTLLENIINGKVETA